jgi:hypothetical protein
MRQLFETVLTAAVLAAGVPSTAAQQEPATALPAAVVAAWTKAGARAGWMATGQYGAPAFRDAILGDGKSGEVPAFEFRKWRGVNDLPPPQRPFGLYLHSSNLTDAGLKELAG